MKKNIIATLIALAVTACSPADNHEKTQTIAEKPATVQASQAQAAPFEVDTSKIEQFDEKVDAQTIFMMFEKIGADKWQAKEQEWKRRLAVAKANAGGQTILSEQFEQEAQKIVAEQFELHDKAAKALAQIEMKSEKGKQMHALLTSGFTGMVEATGALRHLKLSSPEDQIKLEALEPKIQQHAQELMQGMQLYMELMKEIGLKPSPEDEAKIKEANQKIDALGQ